MSCTCFDATAGPQPGIPPHYYNALGLADVAGCPEHGCAYDAAGITLLQGDVLDVLPALEAESVNCIITSPPFWGLRVYAGCPPSIWGGSPDCNHQLDAAPMPGGGYAGRRKWQHRAVSRQTAGDAWVKASFQRRTNDSGAAIDHATCARCGAWRGWLGLEPEPSCGLTEGGLAELRGDLTPEEFEYVIAELRKAGLI